MPFSHLAVWKYTIGDTEYRKEVGNRRGLFHRNDTIAIKYLPESPVESYPIVYMGHIDGPYHMGDTVNIYYLPLKKDVSRMVDEVRSRNLFDNLKRITQRL